MFLFRLLIEFDKFIVFQWWSIYILHTYELVVKGNNIVSKIEKRFGMSERWWSSWVKKSPGISAILENSRQNMKIANKIGRFWSKHQIRYFDWPRFFWSFSLHNLNRKVERCPRYLRINRQLKINFISYVCNVKYSTYVCL